MLTEEFTQSNPRHHPTTWSEKGWTHEIVKRRDRVVLVLKTWPATGFESWEVAKLRLDRPTTFPSGAHHPWRESYPSPEEWGERGWTYTTRQRAEARFSDAVACPPGGQGISFQGGDEQGPHCGTPCL